jgi:hypothetical protein
MNHYTSPELSQQLAEKLDKEGYEFETYFVHFIDDRDYSNEILEGVSERWFAMRQGESTIQAPAFTMCELWEMLPEAVNNHIKTLIQGHFKGHIAKYYSFRNEFGLISFNDENPCNALAQLCIWCIENGHLLNLKKKEQ